MKKILFVTDTWGDSINGVVTSLSHAKQILEQDGHSVVVIHPGDFKTVPMPSYSEIRLALLTRKQMAEKILQELPQYIHIATEGPLGLAARAACVKHGWKFTSHYNTQLPEYIEVRMKFGGEAMREIAYQYLRWFHNASQKTFVPVLSLKQDLESRGFKNLIVVPFGVDADIFKKNGQAVVDLLHPVFVFLGRLAPEKNVEAFLDADLPGSKLIIGDGPSRKMLEEKAGKNTKFVGYKKGQEIVDLLSASDVFVFPSKTDTFGIVIIEAMACGLPVAAYDVPGPRDLITSGVDGYIGEDLVQSAVSCLELNREECRKKALQYDTLAWVKCLEENLVLSGV